MENQDLNLATEISKKLWWPTNYQQISRHLQEDNLENRLYGEALEYFLNITKQELIQTLGTENPKSQDLQSPEVSSLLYSTLTQQNQEKKSLKHRDTQQMAEEFLEQNQDKNVIITLPTGWGKTLVAFKEITKYLNSSWQIIFTTPTHKLTKQQKEAFKEFVKQFEIDLSQSQIKLIHDKDNNISDSKVIFATHSRLQKLQEQGNLQNTDLIIIDEIHEWESWEQKYPTLRTYQNLKQEWTTPRIIGLTAMSTNPEKIYENFDINNWFIGSKFNEQQTKETHDHDKQIEKKINSANFYKLQQELNYTKEYIIHQIISIINRTRKKWYKIPSDLDKYFSKDNLKKSGFIPKDKIQKMKNFLYNCWEQKFSEEEFRYYLFQTLISLYDKINKIIATFEEYDYETALKKTNSFLEELEQKAQDSLEKTDEAQQKKYPETTTLFREAKYNIYQKIYEFINTFKSNLSNENENTLHPKLEHTLQIAEENKRNQKPTIVFVENKELIHRFTEIARQRWFNAAYLTWGTKNKKQKLTNYYIQQQINNQEIDTVFVTSVMKLGMNIDFSELVLYNLPKNEKDYLQFIGRAWRFDFKAQIHFVYPPQTKEWFLKRKVVRLANQKLRQQFKEWEKLNKKWKELNQNEFTNYQEIISQKKRHNFEKYKKYSPLDFYVYQLTSNEIEAGTEIFARFQIEKVDITKNNELQLKLSDSVSGGEVIKCIIQWFNSKTEANKWKQKLKPWKNQPNVFAFNWIFDGKNIVLNLTERSDTVFKTNVYDEEDFKVQKELF